MAPLLAMMGPTRGEARRATGIGETTLRSPMRRLNVLWAALIVGLSLSACASVDIAGGPHDPNDPFEGMNRRLFQASLATDMYVSLPAARFYRDIVPREVRNVIRNFLNNLRAPVIFAND